MFNFANTNRTIGVIMHTENMEYAVDNCTLNETNNVRTEIYEAILPLHKVWNCALGK